MAKDIDEIKLKLTNIKKELIGKKYRHFKGGVYYIRNVTIDSETLDYRVIYCNIEDPCGEYDRPYNMFFSKVVLPNGLETNRFTLLD